MHDAHHGLKSNINNSIKDDLISTLLTLMCHFVPQVAIQKVVEIET